MFVAETASPWGAFGASDPRFSVQDLAAFQAIRGESFEALAAGPITTK